MIEIILDVTIVVVILVGLNFITNLFFDKVISKRISKRKETIILLIINLIKYISLIIGLFVILAAFGIDTTSILAGAGLVGILLGFALQKLLQDFINGFFIIIENQFIVGEYVEINGISGLVLELGLKTTKIMRFTGEVVTISNGEINQVTNFSRFDSLMIVDLVLLNKNDYQTSYNIVKTVLNKYVHHNMTSGLSINGIVGMDELTYTMRITCKTQPYSYFEVARLLKVKLLEELQNNNIEFLEIKLNK